MKQSLLGILFLTAGVYSFGQMTMTSSAMIDPADCNCYKLTDGATNDVGAIWSPVQIDLTNSFDMTFNIFAGFTDGEADGMVFVLQQNPSGVGDVGNKMGYRDVAPLSVPAISAKSFAIEVDTWNSSPTVVTDIASDHIGVEFNNSNEHDLGGPYPISNIEDGLYHTFRVVWDPGFQVITVFLDGSFVFAYNGDIVNSIFTGNPMVYFGWTAATGGVPGTHRVCMYRNADFSEDLTSVCPGFPVTFTDNSTSNLNNIQGYSWDFGDGSPLDMSQSPSHTYTTPGTYTAKLYMTDISGCDDSAEVTITVLPDLVIDVVGVDISCFGDKNGEATATSQNGTGPYTYLWDDVLTQTTQTATDLSPDILYSVTVTDNLGCEGTGTVTISGPTEIIITGIVTYDDGTSNGGVDATITGGTLPYTSTVWSNSATTEDISGVTAGTYTLTVTDANGCTKDTTFNVVSSVGLDELTETLFEVYPNPSHGMIQIKGEGAYRVIISDAAGRVVTDKSLNGNATLNLEADKGVYFVQLIQEERRQTVRLVLE